MVLSSQELVQKLQQYGFEDVDAQRIRYAIFVGRIDRPELHAGRFIYTQTHLDQCRKYFINPPRPGRPPKLTTET